MVSVDQLQSCMMQRQNLEAIFNSVADGIVAVDFDLRVSNLNEAAQHIIGYTREEAIGASCAEVLGLDAEGGLCALFAQRRDANGVEVAIVDRQGLRRHLTVSTRILRDEDAEERGVVAIVRDNTEIEALRQQLAARGRFHEMVGKDHRMREVYQLIDDLSGSDATVLILGESGTGKELVASAVHESSHRDGGPFVKVNCSALSETLLESELFGHVRGAFTGAVRDKVGRFERAHGGTIFLELPKPRPRIPASDPLQSMVPPNLFRARRRLLQRRGEGCRWLGRTLMRLRRRKVTRVVRCAGLAL